MLDKVASEINTVVEASKKSPMFSQFIKDSSVPKDTRVKAITEIFAEAGFSDVTKNFLGMLFAHSCLCAVVFVFVVHIFAWSL
jgi:F-type H+-transporting ATPase subunit O